MIPLSKIDEYLSEDVELSKEGKRLVESLRKAVADGKEIKVVAGEKASANGKHASNGKTKDKAEKPPAKVKKEKVERTGPSSNEMVLKALGKKPMTFVQIVEKTGLSRSQVRYAYLDKLVKEKTAVKTDEGWALKS